MRQLLFLVVLGQFLVSAPAQVTCNRFDVKMQVANHQLALRVVSDLPKDATVSVTVSHRYWRKGETSSYSLDYYSREVTVKDLDKGLSIVISKSAQEKEIARLSGMSRLAGRGAVKVDHFDGRIQVRIVLSQSQKNEDFGPYNRDLSGSQVRHDGPYRGVKVIRYVSLEEAKAKKPKKRSKKSVRVKAAAFQVGSIYGLRQRVPLWSSPMVLSGAKQVKLFEAPNRTLAFIHRKLVLGEKTWFRIAVINIAGEAPMALGWAELQDFGRKKHRLLEDPKLIPYLLPTGWLGMGERKPRYRLKGSKRSPRFEGVYVIEANVILDDGLEASEAQSWAKTAAWQLLERSGAQGAIIHLIREGDKIPQAGTAWVIPAKSADPGSLKAEDFEESNWSGLRAGVSIHKSYFKSRPQALKVGSEVYVKKEGSFEVHVFAQADWKKGDRSMTRVAKGTSGKLLGHCYLEQGGATIIRYHIAFESGQKGWVPGSLVFKF